MNLWRWVLATLGAFGVIVLCEFAIHEAGLGAFYRAHPEWWRAPEQMRSMMGLMFVSQALLAALLSFIYAKGYEVGRGSVVQGFRFGVLMGLLLALPVNLMNFVVYPYPASLILSWIGGTFLEMVFVGVIIGFIYKLAYKIPE